MKIRREEWAVAARAGSSTRLQSSYCRAHGLDMLQTYSYQSKSDRFDAVFVRRSADNGVSWTAGTKVAEAVAGADGSVIRRRESYWLDEDLDRLVRGRVETSLAADSVQAGFQAKRYTYAISKDGGRTFGADVPRLEAGPEYSPDHPIRGVWYGKNSYWQMGYFKLSAREILLPLQVLPMADDGTLVNPLNDFTFTELVFLHGLWDAAGETIAWRSAEPVRIDAERSSRGLIEPTVARLADGVTLVCICRGSNGRLPGRPCWQWLTTSRDGGWTWDPPRRLTWHDGDDLHHPSAMSKLLRHANGKLYWFGNPLTAPAAGNAPRYPLVVAEFDERAMAPDRRTCVVIDTRGPSDSDALQLSNFQVYEERLTGNVILTLCRLFAAGKGDWTAPATRFVLDLGSA